MVAEEGSVRGGAEGQSPSQGQGLGLPFLGESLLEYPGPSGSD